MRRTGQRTDPGISATVETAKPIQRGLSIRMRISSGLHREMLSPGGRPALSTQRRSHLESLRRWLSRRWILALWAGLLASLAHAGHVEAMSLLHEAPEGSEWIMADWMFLSFLLFAGAAFLAFLAALKAGLLSNLEDAKYPILEIEEEDYYTPDWALEEGGNQ
ncbi:MAG: hypothetical protein KatS3mg050_2426 [Litorilinea sp.]|nr:MAG: hypothetical protein KatS3mg050_2426 [Litorilinea sp.]